MIRPHFLVLVLLAGRAARAQGPTCGSDTVLDEANNRCVCPSAGSPSDPDSTDSYLGVLFDADTFEWGPDIVEFTVKRINEGWMEALPSGHTLSYDFANIKCNEAEAARAYWDIRTANGDRPPHGLIGARCSGASIQLARISGLEEVPHLSPASNSATLSDKNNFPFFSRLVAPNDETGEIGAIVALMREFQWERISIIETDTDFAKDMVIELRKLWVGPHSDESGDWTGSVAHLETIRNDPSGGLSQESILQALENYPTNDSRVIFLASHAEDAFQILQQAKITLPSDTIWLGPSGWIGRTDPSNNFSWLPPVPGYLGVALLRNRDIIYAEFLEALQEWQQSNGKEVYTELPVFAAEFVDSIVAMARAVSRAPDKRDGPAIVQSLRQETDFFGVSGRVQFDDKGDRKDPQYSLFNAQTGAVNQGIEWIEVGRVGTTIGSAQVELSDLCLAGVGCGLDEESLPEDTYPPEPDKLEPWVPVVIVLLLLLLIGLAVRYWRSRLSKGKYKVELEALQNSIVGMQASTCDYVPQASIAGKDEEEAAPASSGAPKKAQPAPPPTMMTIQWCWKETEGFMQNHQASAIHGDPADRWVKYGDNENNEVEEAFQKKKKSVSILSGNYTVNFKKMQQIKKGTGFTREIQRVEETIELPDPADTTGVDPALVQIGDKLPAKLIGEPQMVLVEGDVIQISHQSDGWAFGTKLHHANEDHARKLLAFALGKAAQAGVKEEDANFYTDTGWFQTEYSRVPDSKDLEALRKTVGDVGAGSLDAPSHWDTVQDPTVAQKHTLYKGHPEYDALIQSFSATVAGKVVKVERIQNLAMYQSYVVKRSTICYRETGHDNSDDVAAQKKAIERFERKWLWHGSNVDVVGKIINQGFNRSFCGKNATAYGKGVYFARDASYSSHTLYSVPDHWGRQYMLACRVCVGEYCEGKMDALTPDVRDPKSHSLYDSTVGLLRNDTMANPSIYVTYHDAQAYPEYLITFSQK